MYWCSGRILKNEDERTGRIEIRDKEDIPGCGQSMLGYIPTYSRLSVQNILLALGSQQRGY